MDKQTFKTLLHKHYKSPALSPHHPEQTYFSHTFSSTHEENRERHTLSSLVINGVDYTDQLEIVFEKQLSSRSPYKKHYLLKHIEPADYYEVYYTDEYLSDFPVRNDFFKLPAPTRHFKVSVEIATAENYKFSLSLIPFGDYNPVHPPIDLIRPNSLFSHFENVDWTPPSAGYSYIIKPRKEFWDECFLSHSDQEK